MKIQTINDVYAANTTAISKLVTLVENLSDDVAARSYDGKVWNAKQVIEHIVTVDAGIQKICSRLLLMAEKEGMQADGICKLSDTFIANTAESINKKLIAPEIVQPTGSVNISDSLSKLEEIERKFAELKERFEQFDGSKHTFPHPVFGEMSANEWLILRGWHTGRHIKQIEFGLEN